jgi:2-keto-4-pentenoate hydratase/2-oxohepta-3-ene-1,7-dioic acid hydratase in catechol pathway
MRLCSFRSHNRIIAGVRRGDQVVSMHRINRQLGTNFAPTVAELLAYGQVDALRQALDKAPEAPYDGVPIATSPFCAPYTQPEKIWGIDRNYRDDAADLNTPFPTEPASFMKPATTIIGPGEPILLPPQSARVTGAAAIGVIIGKTCKHVALEDVPGVILGFTTILDMTADDVLQRHPHFLTRAKSFDTFFSFGPWIVTPDEVDDLAPLRTTTLLNGVPQRSDLVAHMAFPPYALVAFHAEIMTLKPGDIIACGTPGAVGIRPGDRVGCEVSGIGRLENPVAAWQS